MKFFRWNIPRQLVTAVRVFVVAAILAAGLWPFQAPKNEVRWSDAGRGLVFGKHGSIVNAAPITAQIAAAPTRDGGQAQSGASVEVWVRPTRFDSDGAGAILAFYQPESGAVSFDLRQWRNGVVLETDADRKRTPRGKPAGVYVANLFRPGKAALVTIASGDAGTSIYSDGVLVRKTARFSISQQDLSGKLVVGNPPTTAYGWRGEMKGLAIYRRELSFAEVARDFAQWTQGAAPDTDQEADLVARYDFAEGQGSVVRDQAGLAGNLVIPDRFFVLHEQFLERPWDEYHPGWHYWKDVAINVAGFLPLGFVLFPYLSAAFKGGRAFWLTVALGFAASLTIEVLQAFLPTRDSGMTDLFTNTLGAALGAGVYAWGATRGWFGAPTTDSPAAEGQTVSGYLAVSPSARLSGVTNGHQFHD